MQLCKSCGTGGYLSISNNKDERIEYCMHCGMDHREKRDLSIENWEDKKQQMTQKRLAGIKRR